LLVVAAEICSNTRKMKIKALSRSTSSAQAPGSNVAKITRNLDPNQHPFERAREYTRALNATKIERMFAQPFLGDFESGHVDGVYSFAKDPNSLERFASGSGDGVVKVWDFTSRQEKWQAQAHENMVKGMCWTRDKRLITCGADKQIQMFEPYAQPSKSPPKATWHGNAAFTSVTHHRSLPSFAAASNVVSIYDTARTSGAPVQNLVWPSAIDTINYVSFNQVETSILASCATDRAIVLYDMRTSSPLHRTVLNFASNCISWNPMEAYNFAVANEDHNCYVSSGIRVYMD
jgi:WD repeat and SOF domain-containing protein 1